MEFDKSRVYTILNADELKVGSKVICGFSISHLKEQVDEGEKIAEVDDIFDEDFEKRIHVHFNGGYSAYPLAYLVSEPEPEPKEKRKISLTLNLELDNYNMDEFMNSMNQNIIAFASSSKSKIKSLIVNDIEHGNLRAWNY